MKRKMHCMVLLLVFGGISLLTAQETRKNSIALGISGDGMASSYNRVINDRFSLGLEVSGDMKFGFDTDKNTSWADGILNAQLQGKWYPGQDIFFTGLGLGYSWDWRKDPQRHGFLVQPELGLKFAIGQSGRFIIVPAIGVPVIIGKDKDHNYGSSIETGLLAKLSFGFCF